MLFHVIIIDTFSVVIHVYISFIAVCQSRLLLESGLQIEYLKTLRLIKTSSRENTKNNLHTSNVADSTHSSTHIKNISSYAILENDHLDTAAGFEAHQVYKSWCCEGRTKHTINFTFNPTGQ